MPTWFTQLQQASLNGVPFAVLGAKSRFGRRQAVHEYPFRDTPWPEDIGKASRKFTITGFVVEGNLIYKGADALTQRNKLISVVEAPGPLTLVHPTLGKLSVSIFEMGVEEKWDQGRYFQIDFSFIESGKKVFPKTASSTGTVTQSACATANASTGSDFSNAVSSLFKSGSAVVNQVISTVNAFTRQVTSLAADATSVMHLVSVLSTTLSPSLAGSLGRYAGGALTGFTGSFQPLAQAQASPSATVESLIALGAAGRAAVSAAGIALNASAAAISENNTATFAIVAQMYVAALQNAMADPADSVRVLSDLASYAVIQSNATPVAWAPAAAMQSATNDLLRRAAVIAVASASSSYQPSSSNDAYALRTVVVNMLDTEIDIAGDQGEDATFNALRAVQAAVVADLTTRGAALPAIRQFSTSASLPAPVIAQMLYQDPSRAAELVSEANAIHPAFMPLSFPVLAT